MDRFGRTGSHFSPAGPSGPDHGPKSAAELTLGGWHFARGFWIDGNRRPKRPSQTLEAGFGDMMAVLFLLFFDMLFLDGVGLYFI
jgi:hypothetical protein